MTQLPSPPGAPTPLPKSPASRWTRYLILALLIVGVTLALLFGLRAGRVAMRLWRAGPPPALTDPSTVRGWMTVEYISRSYAVPPQVLYAAIGVPPHSEGRNRRKSLADLNRELAPDQPGFVVERVQAAIAAFHAPPHPDRHDHE